MSASATHDHVHQIEGACNVWVWYPKTIKIDFKTSEVSRQLYFKNRPINQY